MEHSIHQLQYICTMHSEVIRDEPGNCPRCGMDLVPLNPETKVNYSSLRKHEKANPKMGHGGHDHHGMMIDDFKKRFYVVLVFTFPIMFSEMIQHSLNFRIHFPGIKKCGNETMI